MAENTTTISLPVAIKKKAKKISEQMFGSKYKLSAYIQYLITKDVEERGMTND
jgi:hypothetical protein